MAQRPWVIPQEVKEYSEIPAVQGRSDLRLNVDIARAEQYLITCTHNTFEEYEQIPQEIKTAVLLLAEAYAHNAILASQSVKSETFDDYSYTAENTAIDINSLGISSLIDDYIIVEPKNGVTLQMRKI